MTADQVAGLLAGAKEVKSGREWIWIALCPVHGDKKPSLEIKDGDKGVVLYCRSHLCAAKDVCEAIGIRVRDLFYSAEMPLQVRQQLTPKRYRESLQQQLGLVYVLMAIEPHKRRYWEGAEERIELELLQLRRVFDPSERIPIWLKGTRIKPMKANRKILDMIFDIDKDGEYGWSQ